MKSKLIRTDPGSSYLKYEFVSDEYDESRDNACVHLIITADYKLYLWVHGKRIDIDTQTIRKLLSLDVLIRLGPFAYDYIKIIKKYYVNAYNSYR